MVAMLIRLTCTTGMDFPRDYSKIPDIPKLSPKLTQIFPVYTQTSPEVYLVYPDYPLRCPEKPMSALRTP